MEGRRGKGRRRTTGTSGDDQDDFIMMQLDEDEGLLTDLDAFMGDAITSYEGKTIDIPAISSGEESSLESSNGTEDDSLLSTDRRFRRENHALSSNPKFQRCLEDLTEAMDRSARTRQSLYCGKHRSSYTKDVVWRTEFSSRQIHYYGMALRADDR